MDEIKLVAPEFVSLKDDPKFDESWLQNHLKENPGLLGLGELDVRDAERRQPSGGRIDLLLEDVEGETRFEVELQLGEVDASHIIRTIEYWDIERRRYPQYDHIAVIVAENVTSRFLNVISLFNGAIPLIAIQLRCVKVNDAFTLVATRVLDVVQLGTEDEDEGVLTDRAYWKKKATEGSLELIDQLLKIIAKISPGVKPNYTKRYIGLEYSGQSRNFVVFKPRKSIPLVVEVKVPHDDARTRHLSEVGLERIDYNHRNGKYQLSVTQEDLKHEHRRDVLSELFEDARDHYDTK